MPTPDPSASLTPFQAWTVATATWAGDQVQWVMVLLFIGISLLIGATFAMLVVSGYRT